MSRNIVPTQRKTRIRSNKSVLFGQSYKYYPDAYVTEKYYKDKFKGDTTDAKFRAEPMFDPDVCPYVPEFYSDVHISNYPKNVAMKIAEIQHQMYSNLYSPDRQQAVVPNQFHEHDLYSFHKNDDTFYNKKMFYEEIAKKQNLKNQRVVIDAKINENIKASGVEMTKTVLQDLRHKHHLRSDKLMSEFKEHYISNKLEQNDIYKQMIGYVGKDDFEILETIKVNNSTRRLQISENYDRIHFKDMELQALESERNDVHEQWIAQSHLKEIQDALIQPQAEEISSN